jgi:hypothetical protein
MAKLKRGIVQMSGKYGDAVFVNSNKYGYHIRQAPAAGSKKDEPALAAQYSRNSFLNTLASELNRLMAAYFPRFKSTGFYHTVQKCFRREPLNNRFLLLRQLKGLDLNPTYPINKLGKCNLTTNVLKRQINVRLQVALHPPAGKYQADCYYYEVTLFCWNKTDQPALADWQVSDWIPLAGKRPVFEFGFAVPPGTLHWLLCLRQQLGINQQEAVYFAAQGVQLVEAGSFDKKDVAILEKRKQEAVVKPATKTPGKVVAEMERVKAKGFL